MKLSHVAEMNWCILAEIDRPEDDNKIILKRRK